ncbi:MAG: tRNA pseudouridine(55) synthase TruB [Oligoflexus sp.]
MKAAIRRPAPQDGMLLVYKPGGMTSKDVSRWFQQRFGKIKMGHVGTLDPLAEGLLPLLFGKATRLQDFILSGVKCYEFDVAFGVATDTLDADGQVVAHAAKDHITHEGLEEACRGMQGDFLQVPPLYSAIKFQGKPLYEYARQGLAEQVPLQLLRKTVRLYELTCLHYGGGIGRFRVVCSKGTYVRVIATQLAERVSSLGMITRLLRVSSGELQASSAYSLEQIEARLDAIDSFVIPLHAIKLDIPTWQTLDVRLVERLKMGQEMHVEMKCFEGGLATDGVRRATIRSLDHVVLIDNNGRSFGIGSAIVLNTGRIAVRMRRGLS